MTHPGTPESSCFIWLWTPVPAPDPDPGFARVTDTGTFYDFKHPVFRNFTLLNPAFGRATKGGIQQGEASSIISIRATQCVAAVSCHKIEKITIKELNLPEDYLHHREL